MSIRFVRRHSRGGWRLNSYQVWREDGGHLRYLGVVSRTTEGVWRTFRLWEAVTEHKTRKAAVAHLVALEEAS